MASAAVLWFGEDMSAVPLRNNKAAASAVRTVTVLGATGSIGDSTMDLLRGARDRYQVEALTANSNVAGAGEARQGIRRALCGDRRSRAPCRIEGSAWPAPRTECGAGESADHRSGRASRRLGDGRGQRRGRTEARARRRRSRRDGGARQQGMPGLRRRFLHAARGEGRRLHPAGGFRAQRAVPGARLRQPRRTGPRHHHRLRRTVPHLGQRRYRAGDAGAGAETSELEHGPEDHHRFRRR